MEQNYITACLAYTIFPGQPFPPARSDTDWERVYILVDHHRLSGHLFMLGQNIATAWPENFERRLQLDCYQYSLYGNQCSKHIRSLLETISKAGIKVIVLKGWAHIQTIYGGDYGQRLCEDIDILVHPKDVDIIEDILRQLNYSIEMESWPGYNRRYHNGVRYFVSKARAEFADTFSVGLHWGLIHMPSYDPRRIDVDTLFANAMPLKVLGVTVLQLSPEDEVVYLCGHIGLHHRFDDALFRYYELARLLRMYEAELDWEKITERAIKWRHVLPVRHSLNRINQIWPGVVHPDTLEMLDCVKVGLNERFIELWIKKTRGYPTFDHILRWFTFPRVWERPLIVIQDILPSPVYMVSRYGAAPLRFWPLLYVLRFFRSFRFWPNKKASNSDR